jgi:hypothetical protein
LLSRAVAIAAVASALGGPAAAPAFGAAPAPAETLRIAFTAETRGNLVPCSCPKEPLGGLARRARHLAEAAFGGSPGTTSFVLDAGGFLPEGEVPLRDAPEAMARYVRLVLRGFLRSGLQASALDHGEREFLRRHAPSEAERLRDALLDADPPGPPRVLHWGSKRVAVLALEESTPDSTAIRAGVGARSSTDFLIVLARADAVSGRRLARLSRADLVILSRGARPAAPLREGSAHLVGCGREGREVGDLRLVPDAGATAGQPRLRVASFALRPMNADQAEDPDLSREVANLLREAGPAPLAGTAE